MAHDAFIFYECHVGTFTAEGTFESVIEKIGYLQALGITCLELMPLMQFSGKWGWGYDGVSLFAPHNAYGNPLLLKQLVNACHKAGIHVCLDIVLSHFGPEGCFLGDFGPYWSDRYHTPWGKAVNLDGPCSDEVRHFLLQNVLYWIDEFHIDAFRLDALHAIYDCSAHPFLKQLSQAVEKRCQELGRKIYCFAESDLNDSSLVRPIKQGGFGFDSWWNEDFHHALHVALTGEQNGYYQDFKGIEDLEKAFTHGAIFEGQYSPFRKKEHGNSFQHIPPEQFIAFLQNHDQIGNRLHGNRLSSTLSFHQQKMSALILTLGPFLPLLFMGQEYGEEASFEYFVDYQDKDLLANVYEGRKREFGLEGVEGMPHPDESAFLRSKLRWDYESDARKKALLQLYQQLISFRKNCPLFHPVHAKEMKVYSSIEERWIAWEYHSSDKPVAVLCTFDDRKQTIQLPFTSQGERVLHTDQKVFGGTEALLYKPQEKTVSVQHATGLLLY